MIDAGTMLPLVCALCFRFVATAGMLVASKLLVGRLRNGAHTGEVTTADTGLS